MTFSLTSPAFTEGGSIPRDNACDGADSPVSLAWSGEPSGTTELALIMDDPDAGGFVHWVVVGIPAGTGRLDGAALPSAALQGRNSFGGVGYRGPCPPSGTHRYVLTLIALSSALGLTESPSAEEVRSSASTKTLGEARLTGRYTRSR
jgi:Raf kinase inhibitor-like YbhB/YbcL family protein